MYYIIYWATRLSQCIHYFNIFICYTLFYEFFSTIHNSQHDSASVGFVGKEKKRAWLSAKNFVLKSGFYGYDNRMFDYLFVIKGTKIKSSFKTAIADKRTSLVKFYQAFLIRSFIFSRVVGTS